MEQTYEKQKKKNMDKGLSSGTPRAKHARQTQRPRAGLFTGGLREIV